MSAGSSVFGAIDSIPTDISGSSSTLFGVPTSTVDVTPRLEWSPRRESQSSTLSGALASAVDVNPWLVRSLQRLAELARLKTDWDSYGSPKPSADALSSVIGLLLAVQEEPIGEPEIVPASGGGISLVWENGARELEIEVLSTGHIEYLRIDENAPAADRVLEERVMTAQLLPARSLVRWVVAR
jgi:hypothetical protein